MVNRDETVDYRNFAVGIDKVLGDLPKACADNLGDAVRTSVRKTAKGLRSGIYGAAGKHEWSEAYMKGFTSRADTRGMTPEGEVGNKAKPGLVHLLEKGHLTLAGRRTHAYPHMTPAFNEMESDFMKLAEQAIGRALRG